MTDDLSLGGNTLIFDALAINEYSASVLEVVLKGTATRRDWACRAFFANSWACASSLGVIATRNYSGTPKIDFMSVYGGNSVAATLEQIGSGASKFSIPRAGDVDLVTDARWNCSLAELRIPQAVPNAPLLPGLIYYSPGSQDIFCYDVVLGWVSVHLT